MQEAPATKTSLLCWYTGLVFQLDDLGINTLFPTFLGTLNVYVLLRMHYGGKR